PRPPRGAGRHRLPHPSLLDDRARGRARVERPPQPPRSGEAASVGRSLIGHIAPRRRPNRRLRSRRGLKEGETAMKRALTCASFVCVIGAALGMLAVPAAHAATVNCSGTPTFPNNRTGNDLNVPSGATCTLSNVTVGGDVIVQPGGNLVLLGATVGGNLFTNVPGSFRIDALSSSCAGTTCTQPSLIRGNATFSG